jgi:hypothetical protein
MFSKECLTKVVGALLMLSPLPALAQTYSRPGYYSEMPPEVRRPGPASGYGSTVTLGGGVMNFTGAGARGATSTGGAWGLRIGWGTRAILGAEAAYIGSANKMSSVPGLDPHAVLLGTGAEGNLRLNAPFLVRDTVIEPFALGGVGWTRFDIINDDFNTSGALEKDHVMTVPVGAGFAMGVHGLMIDARYTYRFVFNEDLLGKTSLDNWIVSANIGSEF